MLCSTSKNSEQSVFWLLQTSPISRCRRQFRACVSKKHCLTDFLSKCFNTGSSPPQLDNSYFYLWKYRDPLRTVSSFNPKSVVCHSLEIGNSTLILIPACLTWLGGSDADYRFRRNFNAPFSSIIVSAEDLNPLFPIPIDSAAKAGK